MTATEPSTPDEHVSFVRHVVRTVVGGFLMGLANLVPGISGGTMILAVGLYDRFIGAVADVTRLRLRLETLAFLGVLGLALVATVVTLAGPIVTAVTDYRWVAYSLFVGLTLGGVPELARRSRPFGPGVATAVAAGVGAMVLLAMGLTGTRLPETIPVFLLVGAAAASSMILPGISGSYVLLILGVYDVVIGHLSPSAWRADAGEAARIVGPVVVGAGLGIAILSNVLRALLARAPRVSHGALLGLLLGSVIGLWPFQRPVHPELAQRETRKAVAMLVDGAGGDAIRERWGAEFDDARLAELGERYGARSGSELKTMGDALQFFTPGGVQIAVALGLLVLGFCTTLALGRWGG